MSGRALQGSVTIVAAMMTMHGVRGRTHWPVFFTHGDVLRPVLDTEHTLDSAGDAADHGARDPAEHRAGDF